MGSTMTATASSTARTQRAALGAPGRPRRRPTTPPSLTSRRGRSGPGLRSLRSLQRASHPVRLAFRPITRPAHCIPPPPPARSRCSLAGRRLRSLSLLRSYRHHGPPLTRLQLGCLPLPAPFPPQAPPPLPIPRLGILPPPFHLANLDSHCRHPVSHPPPHHSLAASQALRCRHRQARSSPLLAWKKCHCRPAWDGSLPHRLNRQEPRTTRPTPRAFPTLQGLLCCLPFRRLLPSLAPRRQCHWVRALLRLPSRLSLLHCGRRRLPRCSQLHPPRRLVPRPLPLLLLFFLRLRHHSFPLPHHPHPPCHHTLLMLHLHHLFRRCPS